jgi:hypothetical protein
MRGAGEAVRKQLKAAKAKSKGSRGRGRVKKRPQGDQPVGQSVGRVDADDAEGGRKKGYVKAGS